MHRSSEYDRLPSRRRLPRRRCELAEFQRSRSPPPSGPTLAPAEADPHLPLCARCRAASTSCARALGPHRDQRPSRRRPSTPRQAFVRLTTVLAHSSRRMDLLGVAGMPDQRHRLGTAHGSRPDLCAAVCSSRSWALPAEKMISMPRSRRCPQACSGAATAGPIKWASCEAGKPEAPGDGKLPQPAARSVLRNTAIGKPSGEPD